MRFKHAVIKLGIAVIAMWISAGVGYLFYKHLVIAGVFSFAGLLAVPRFEAFLEQRRKQGLLNDFRQFLHAFSTSLAAGKSVDNALISAEKDLELLFQTKRRAFLVALKSINSMIANGAPADKAFQQFADRCEVADIQHFAEVFALCKHSGGDLVELIRSSAGIIAEKLEIEQDILVMTAQKRFEAKAMMAAPFLIIAFLALGSPDYMEPLYEGIGRLWTTGVLIMLMLCSLWIQTIMRLEV